ncbi:DUF6193 family natural product biosynthesis protein [Streptomyces sp. NPDC059918]|uniref:DUF6193 family natural product biosynthesis protein n=1 Tax=unclassified Streptomyces TaxID=2593676 RepID=UPI00365EB3CB
MTTDDAGTNVVEAAWQRLLRSDQVSAELVAAAYAEPRLRELFPWIGMWELHLSRCTDHPFTWDVPYIGPRSAGVDHTGPYYVEGPHRSERIGEAATARQAVAMVIPRLPEGCGPAFIGTGQELAERDGSGR